MEEQRRELIEKIVNEQFQIVYSKDKEIAFAWELFWKFDIFQKIYDYNIEVMFKAIAIDKRKDFNVKEKIDIKDKEVLNVINQCKKTLFKQHGIKKIKISHFYDQIVTFMTDKRQIDFKVLDSAAVDRVLFEEDCMGREYSLSDALGMTHMQFKYLYQKGSVYL
jgi:hypothetical protein